MGLQKQRNCFLEGFQSSVPSLCLGGEFFGLIHWRCRTQVDCVSLQPEKLFWLYFAKHCPKSTCHQEAAELMLFGIPGQLIIVSLPDEPASVIVRKSLILPA